LFCSISDLCFKNFYKLSGGVEAEDAGYTGQMGKLQRVHFIALWSHKMMKQAKTGKAPFKSMDQHSESCHATEMPFVPSVVSLMRLGVRIRPFIL